MGCLDRRRLSAAVDRLTDTGAVSVTVTGSGVRAEVPAGSKGLAVLAAPRIAGWKCDGKPAASYLGLVAAPLNGSQTTVDCSFRPPGLRLGSMVAGSALIVLVSVPSSLPRVVAPCPRRPLDTNPSSIEHWSVARRAHVGA
ncbi:MULTISPECIES: hypothetical protein [unclassified Streptomyces]|uniref:hypothetical protein n=1 Tax=unclassified Streptomyces TaxID=2593676 RepID=UPI00343A98D6